jgi:hypothetical protein
MLLRDEYLVTENRILRNQIKGRVHLSDGERMTVIRKNSIITTLDNTLLRCDNSHG